MIESFISGALIVTIFFIIYFLIRNINIWFTKFYIFITQMILIYEIVSCVLAEEIDVMFIVLLLFYEILLISFIRDLYKEDQRVACLYKMISRSHLNPIFLCGLQEIQNEKLDMFYNELNKFLNYVLSTKTPNFGYIVMENDELQISIILFKKNLVFDDIASQISYSENLKIENIKKGCQINYSIKC